MPDDRHKPIAEWFLQWGTPLKKFLSRGSAVAKADLDDVAQEVFLRLLRADRVELINHPQAYLFQMARHVAVEWATRARNRMPHDSAWLDELPDEDDPETLVARDSERRSVARALQTLPARQREILRLHYGEGLLHARIAERLGVTERVVKRDIIKAYATLRLDLGTQGDAYRQSEASGKSEGPR
jgi:RNA polymerase sigma-70 factor (ECF subfamily)